MTYFKIIIPNYNNEQWIKKCLDSIYNQTFKDYEVVVIDDVSTDDSVNIIENHPLELTLIRLDHKAYNGGARNKGIRYDIPSKYTMFIDSDDWLYSNDVLQAIHDKLEETKVDCLTIQYNCILEDSEIMYVMKRNNLHDLVFDESGACWTKVIKTDLIVEFPENTLMEDTVQHINQCNYIKTMDTLNKTCIAYNRMNTNALTNPNKKQSIKWKASILRLIADLYELWCPNEECEARRQLSLESAKNMVKEGRFIQW